jgi:hypothetical protein
VLTVAPVIHGIWNKRIPRPRKNVTNTEWVSEVGAGVPAYTVKRKNTDTDERNWSLRTPTLSSTYYSILRRTKIFIAVLTTARRLYPIWETLFHFKSVIPVCIKWLLTLPSHVLRLQNCLLLSNFFHQILYKFLTSHHLHVPPTFPKLQASPTTV